VILKPYPWYAFPKLASAAIQEASALTQAPVALVALAAVSAMSAACQDRVRIRRLPRLEGPVNTYTLVVALSGERKSATDALFGSGFRKVEKVLAAEHDKARNKRLAEMAIWTSRCKVINRRIEEAQKKDLPTAELQEELESLLLQKPTALKCPSWLLGDASADAIMSRLHRWPSAALLSDEAGAIFASRTVHNLGLLNKLWDEGIIQVDRVSRESYVVRDAKLTAGLMVQPAVMDRFLQRHGMLARSSGFLARFFIASPLSTQGTRFINPFYGSTEALCAFERRVVELLSETVKLSAAGQLEAATLEFDAEAQAVWNTFHDTVEAQLGQNGFLADVADNAAKIAENAARLAGIFHFFEGEKGLITAATMRMAVEIATWHLLEFKSLFGAAAQFSPTMLHANRLESWLRYFAEKGVREVKQRHILQFGPNELRKKNRLEPALHLLASEGKIAGEIRNGTTWVILKFATMASPGARSF